MKITIKRNFGTATLTSLLALSLLSACGTSTGPEAPPVETFDPVVPLPVVPIRNRYSFNNQCFVVRSNETGNYLERSGGTYTATQADVASAEAFYFKPSALGDYLLYNRSGELVSADAGLANLDLQSANDTAVFTVVGFGDPTVYPPTPEGFREPTAAEIAEYRNFVDPNLELPAFTLYSRINDLNLASDDTGTLSLVAAAADQTQSFTMEPVTGCAEFPEASSNFEGTPFRGTTPDGRVLGMTDGHVHISATDFLGKAEWGFPFHKFGVTHALGLNCEEYHGPNGSQSAVEAGFEGDADGHNTTGWPTFPEWPNRNNLFHEAIYWKWLERAWAAGLRVIVNDLVDNETLCELSRNVAQDPTLDCNSMNNAGRQAGTMYAMQDYIDAQYGGRGEGFFQITHSPAEARTVIADGKAAVVLGIEISNFLNCKVNFNPARTQEPFEEDGSGGAENTHTCRTTETGAPDEILTQIQRIHDWGVRQVITIHEFDNAFGGNGIFGGLVLNLGNREDTGAIPGGALANSSPPGSDPSNPEETPTGELWTTYDCPEEGGLGLDGNPFSGYLWSNQGGDDLESLDPSCPYQGQGGRPGGPTPCYPALDNASTTTRRQCNARWLTPTGLYLYERLMEFGLIFDIDHLEMEMKTQALEVAEAQDPPYPFVSTHGTFGGTSNDQASRMLTNGGLLYPSIGSSTGFVNDMRELRQVWEDAGQPHGFFGFGFGTDTNGLSGQAGPRSAELIEQNPIVYPYTLFDGLLFDQLADFNGNAGITPVVFNQPESRDSAGNGRTWHADIDGNAHYGMLSANVMEVNMDAEAQDLADMFNSAEAFLLTWERTFASRDGILAKAENDNGDADDLGNTVVPPGVLRAAPLPDCELGRRIPDPRCFGP